MAFARFVAKLFWLLRDRSFLLLKEIFFIYRILVENALIVVGFK